MNCEWCQKVVDQKYCDKICLENANKSKQYKERKQATRLARRYLNGATRLIKLKRKGEYRSNTRRRILAGCEEKFYKSSEWKELRERILVNQGRKCRYCGTVEGELHVDHIKPRYYFPDLALEPGNLQVLCRKCNFNKGASKPKRLRKRRNKKM